MISKEAIEALCKAEAITAATKAVLAAESDSVATVVALPNDFKLHDIETHLQLRRRARGKMSTSVLADFAAYAKTHSEAGASVLVNPKRMVATAVLNLGTPDAPGHADNLAVLQYERTAAYRALLLIANGVGQKQATVAEFLEDWPGLIQCFDGNAQLTPPRAIAAIRKISIESMKKLESSAQQLSESRSAFEEIQAKSGGADPLPTTIYFNCAPYQGLQERQFVMRLSILTGGSTPAIALRIAKEEEHEEEMAEEMATQVREALADIDTPVYLGDYAVAA